MRLNVWKPLNNFKTTANTTQLFAWILMLVQLHIYRWHKKYVLSLHKSHSKYKTKLKMFSKNFSISALFDKYEQNQVKITFRKADCKLVNKWINLLFINLFEWTKSL